MVGTSEVTCIADVGALLGEGPVWVEREQALYWVDITEGRLFRWSADEGTRSIFENAQVPVHICSLVPRSGGGFIGAGHDGFMAIDLEQGRIMMLGNPDSDLDTNRFNDGKV